MNSYFRSEFRSLRNSLIYFLKWTPIALGVALLAGTASAALLASLDWASAWRENHLWILIFLPVLGAGIAWAYLKFGGRAEGGNNLIVEEIHQNKEVLPLSMSPLVFLGTVGSHLVGASVGREGTALQMASSLVDQFSKLLRLRPEERRNLLMCGLSAGFGSIFGVPLAGAIFGLEMPYVGRFRFEAVYPCFVASLLADFVTRAWGIHHVEYQLGPFPNLTLEGLGSALLAGILFGLAARYFTELTHFLSAQFRRKLHYAPARPFIGGILIFLILALLGSTRYAGLSLPLIAASFKAPVAPWDFLGKLGLTALSLGAGFKGGEVTPLFCIGASLGSVLSLLLPLATPLLAAMGFVSVFGGAANTPIASIVMAYELFGAQVGPYAGAACICAFLVSGQAGIYHAQWKAPGMEPYKSKHD